MSTAVTGTWYDFAYRDAYRQYDAECPFDLCNFLSNSEAVSGSLMSYGLRIVRYGCGTLEQLMGMAEADVRAMGAAIGMKDADVERLLERRFAEDPRFVMPAPLDKAFDYFMTQVEMLFLQTDADGSGDLDREELLRIFEKASVVTVRASHDGMLMAH